MSYVRRGHKRVCLHAVLGYLVLRLLELWEEAGLAVGQNGMFSTFRAITEQLNLMREVRSHPSQPTAKMSCLALFVDPVAGHHEAVHSISHNGLEGVGASARMLETLRNVMAEREMHLGLGSV